MYATILFPEKLNKFAEAFTVMEMHTFKHELFLLQADGGWEAGNGLDQSDILY